MRLSRELNLPFLLGFEQIPHADGDGAHSLSDAGSQDCTTADSRYGRQRSCGDEYGTECRHRSGMLCGQEVERMARIE